MDPESKIQTAHPGEPFPKLTLQTLDGDVRLPTDQWTLMVGFRGLHCDICSKHLAGFQEALDGFLDLDVRVVAFSMETKRRTEKLVQEWGLDKLEVAYGLGSADAARLGLFLSTAVKEAEPDRFSEPGIFLTRPDGTLQAMWVQCSPQIRPKADQLLKAVRFYQETDEPPRGVHQTEVATRTH